MEGFTNIESLYNHLEKNATNYKYPHQIGKLFQNVRDLKHKEKKLDEAEKAQWEVDFFNFTLRDGKLHPMFSGTNDKGELSQYPTLEKFNNKVYEYLIERLDATANLLLKARYAHILWCSPRKHARYAKVAVDSYLALIKTYETKDKKEPQDHYGLDVLNVIENVLYISHQIKYRIDEVKSEMRRLVNRFNFKSSSSFALRTNLIKLMLKRKKGFHSKDFLGFEKICWIIANSLVKAGNIHGAIDMLELGEIVDQKMGKKTHNWRRRIAESWETLMKQGDQNGNLASLTFCQCALENYKKLKDKSKIKELEKKYCELKNSMQLTETKTEIDLTSHVKRCREIAKRIIQNESDEIIKILMLDKTLLPKYKDMEKRAERHSKQFVFQQLAPTEIIDQSGHTAQHFSEGDEKKYYGILQEYDWELRFNKIHLINEIFLTAIRESKLSSDILLRFLNTYSWFGKTIYKKVANNKIGYNWLSLIAPSIHEYFLQMQYHFANPNYLPYLVLSIDSLTLKFEGLIRDICQFSGTTTFYMTSDNKGRSITREKDIHHLLYEEPIQKLFDEDDLLFFRFLLVEKVGYNLRHKVAHSLMLFQDYTIPYMHLLILALLKLGKYDFVEKDDNTSHAGN
jgi:hypothetical protein